MRSALLVLDFINDIAHAKGKIARSAERIAAHRVIENANQVIAHARAQHWPIYFVKVGFHPGYIDCPKHSPMFSPAAQHGALLLGSWGTQFHEKLAFQENDPVVVKHRVSAFYATSLEALLGAQEIEQIVLTGTATNMAVEHTGRDAHDRDYSVVVIRDACEAATEEAHKAALESLGRFAQVITSGEL